MLDKRNVLLNTFEFLSQIENKKLDKLIENIHISSFDPGTIILREGNACEYMVFILGGVIRVYKLSPEGREITLYHITKGETCILLNSCIVENNNYPAIAEVEEDVQLAIIPSLFFNELIFPEPSYQKYIFGILSKRLTEVLTIVDEVAFKHMDTRIATFLYDKALKSGNRLEITHEKISMELGSAREVVSRILKDFEKQNILSLSRGIINIIDMKKIIKIKDM